MHMPLLQMNPSHVDMLLLTAVCSWLRNSTFSSGNRQYNKVQSNEKFQLMITYYDVVC